jgi:hypothetical protein
LPRSAGAYRQAWCTNRSRRHRQPLRLIIISLGDLSALRASTFIPTRSRYHVPNGAPPSVRDGSAGLRTMRSWHRHLGMFVTADVASQLETIALVLHAVDAAEVSGGGRRRHHLTKMFKGTRAARL